MWIALLIFFARVADVTLQTMRIIFVTRGVRLLAAVCGFFEVLIWLIAITQVMQNLSSWITYVAYASGFAAGNIVGISLEQMLSVGNLMVRVITHKDATRLERFLRARHFGVTATDARGAMGSVKIIFTIVRRKDLRRVLRIIKRFNPQAFYTIEDVRLAADRKLLPFHARLGRYAGSIGASLTKRS